MALRKLWGRMTPMDKGLLLSLLGLAICLMLALTGLPSGRRFIVEQQGRIVYQAPLGQPIQFQIDGPLGPTELVVSDRGVRIVDSPCPHKVCIGMGWARRTGEWLACVPNLLLVRIEGGDPVGEEDYDLLSR